MKADHLTYNAKTKYIIAKGKVSVEAPKEEGKKFNKAVFSDYVTYDKNHDILTATGNVMVRDVDGNITHSDKITFQNGFDDGRAENVRLTTQKNERLLAENITRASGKTIVLDRASYTPCRVCKREKPTWEILAERITHDKDAQNVSYKNARLEVKGVPVFYTPYFSHPSPDIKRKSGLLRPSFGASGLGGTYYAQPAYYTFDPSSDVTVTPIFYNNDNPMIWTHYRKAIKDGIFEGQWSFIHTKKHPLSTPTNPINGYTDRWHVLGTLEKEFNPQNRMLAKIHRASDITYLRRYPLLLNDHNQLPQNANLTSHMVFEHTGQNLYTTATGYAYQTHEPKYTPLVLPKLYGVYQLPNPVWGGNLRFDFAFKSLYRDQPTAGVYGRHTHTMSSKQSFERQHITHGGHYFRWGVHNDISLYFTKNYTPQKYISTPNLVRKNNITGRFVPQIFAQYDYPLLSTIGGYQTIIKPTIMTTATFFNTNNPWIPNEDARTFLMDDTRIFMKNRFDGRDRLDGGIRVVYGYDQTVYFENFKKINVFMGHAVHLNQDHAPSGTERKNHGYDDIVARILFTPKKHVNMRVRTAFNPNNGAVRYFETGVNLKASIFKIDLGYVNFKHDESSSAARTSQIHWNLSSQMSEKWSVFATHIHSFQKTQRQFLYGGIGIQYQDDCLEARVSVYKSGFRDRDIRPNEGVGIELIFKNLGHVSSQKSRNRDATLLSKFTP